MPTAVTTGVRRCMAAGELRAPLVGWVMRAGGRLGGAGTGDSAAWSGAGAAMDWSPAAAVTGRSGGGVLALAPSNVLACAGPGVALHVGAGTSEAL